MPADPFVVPVAELLRNPGLQRRVVAVGPISGVGLPVAEVPEDADVHLDVTLEAQSSGSLTVIGRVRAPWTGECRRCLGIATGEAGGEVSDIYDRHPVDGETYLLDHDRVDLRAMARDVLVLSLPLAALCRPDCAGPDPEAHPVVPVPDDAASAGGTQEPDPRWRALGELRFDE